MNNSSVEIINTVEYIELSDSLLESFLDFQEMLHQASKRGEILRSREFRRKKLLEPLPDDIVVSRYFAIIEDKIVGYGIAQHRVMNDDPNPEKLEIHFEVHPEFRRNGIGKQILQKLFNFREDVKRTKYEAWISPINGIAGEEFCKLTGLKKVIEERSSRLYKNKINWKYIDQQKIKHSGTLDKYKFIMLNRVSWAEMMLKDERMAQEMADFFTEVVNLIPREEIDGNDFKETIETAQASARQILRTPTQDGVNYYAFENDKIIAMSGTYYSIDRPVKDVGTGLTGVRKEYQRQGLASLLKIMVIDHYVKEFPEFEYIFTENAQSNEGMLSINQNLGFEYAFSWEMWQRK